MPRLWQSNFLGNMFAIAISDKNCQNESIIEIQKFYNCVGYLGHMCRKGHKEKKLVPGEVTERTEMAQVEVAHTVSYCFIQSMHTDL